MAQFETWLEADLQKMIKPQMLTGAVFSADSMANLVGVKVYNGGAPATVGGSVSGKIIRADGVTVPVSGTLSGNAASIVLPQAAYAVIGPITISIAVTEGGATTTLACAVGVVTRTSTDTTVDPGTIIPSIDALIAQINAAINSIPADYSALLAAIAPTFSASAAYPAGAYVWQGGTLYRFTAAHPAGSWTGTDATAAVVGNDLADLKSAFDQISERSVNVLNVVKPYTVYTDTTYKFDNNEMTIGTASAGNGQSRFVILLLDLLTDAFMESGITLTASFDLLSQMSGAVGCHIGVINTSGNFKKLGDLFSVNALGKHTGTVTIGAASISSYSGCPFAIRLYGCYNQTITVDDITVLGNPQIEIGDAATPYSPYLTAYDQIARAKIDTLETTTKKSVQRIDLLETAVRNIEYIPVDGYHANNATVSNPSVSPFIPRPFIEDSVITGIKININTAGVLSFGYYKSTDVSAGGEFDPEKRITVTEYTFTETGEQTITFDAPLYIPEGCVFCVGANTDTAKFLDGANGATKGFFYRQSSSALAFLSSNKSLGLTIYAIKNDVRSTQHGKKLSIYGDSISTFTGWIPDGNAVFYNGTNCGVTSVEDTWWKKIINALQYELLVNNSWSGRAVSNISDGTTAHATDAGYKEANVLQLKSGNVLPDVIIVKLGINDFDRECPLGTYDGSTALPTDPSTFTNAYAIMLNLIMTNFPLAHVYCCTLTAAEKNGATGFPEINGNGESLTQWNNAIRQLAGAFGASVLDHSSCGLTYYNMSTYMGDWNATAQTALHPNAAGHSLIANQTIHEIDNAVRVRY